MPCMFEKFKQGTFKLLNSDSFGNLQSSNNEPMKNWFQYLTDHTCDNPGKRAHVAHFSKRGIATVAKSRL